MNDELNSDNMTLEEKLAAIDNMMAQKQQRSDADTTDATNVDVANDPALDLMCGDACQ